MVRTKRFSVWLMLGSTLNLFVPSLTAQAVAQTQVINATQRTAAQVRPTDVSLDVDNQLCGTVVNANGAPLSATNIRVFRDSNLVAAVKTDNRGAFRTGPLAGGIHQLVTGNQTMTLRVWTRDAAPPTATPQLLLADRQIVRGQCNYPSCEIENCDGGCGGSGRFGLLLHPLVIGAVVAAAIAIPLALDDDDDDAS